VNCRSCGRALEPGSRFCPSCGTPVEAACRSCGASLAADARFCASCGTPVAAASGPLAAESPDTGRERKVATMVFADLVGFTSLNESSDPELVQALVTRAFDRLSAEVVRYEGTVEKFAGDAMLAVFGVPATHEDDAERAVRAALEMQAAMSELAAELRTEGRPELALRIGVETGEVLVDLGRAQGERDRIVTGDAVNTAARLQQVAAPGTIVVGPFTYAATRDVVEYDELPPTALKGKALPVAAWRAVAVKARRGGVRPSLGIEAPLIGRDEEMSLIKETVRRTVSDGRPHLVTVIGSAGVGKSRLTWELEKYLDGLPETFYWRKGRCLAYAQASFSALADAVKADARILDDDAPATAAAKLEARVGELGSAADPALLRAVEALLALGPATGLGRDQLFDAWRRYLELLAHENPLVLVQEDIHWADEGLLDFIEYMARWAEGPIVLLCLARHELLELRPTWGGGMPNAASIVLEPLDPAESAQLVDALLAGGLPAELRDRVVTLADGNPLFTEELVRMFVDRGVLRFGDGRWQLARPVEEVEIPGSIHAVLAARLDGLPAAEKRAAQNAAVVGRIFWDALISHLSRQGTSATGEVLRRLRVKELVVPRQPSALAGAAEFGFRHVLIRDVAYDSLPKRDRAAKHLDVARWAEETLADRQEEMVELLAAHYLAALRYEEEFAGPDPDRLRELRGKTYTYARRAGARADDVYNKEQAARWFRVAVEQARVLDLPARERAALAVEYDRAAGGYEPHEAMRATLEDALALMVALPDRTADDEQQLATLRIHLAVYLYVADELDAARAVVQTGIAALEAGPPTPGRAGLRARLGWTYWRAGPVAEAPSILRQAIEEARACGAQDVERMALHDLGVATGMLGDAKQSLALVEQSMELARAANDRLLMSRCHINVPAIAYGNGETTEGLMPLCVEGLDRARRSMDHVTASWIAQNIADFLAFEGRLDEALTYAEEAIVNAGAVGDESRLANCIAERAYVRLLTGDREGARADFVESRRLSGTPEPQSVIYDAMFDALFLWPDDPSAACRSISEALHSPDVAPPSLLDTAPNAVRMALRLGDAERLAGSLAAYVAVVERCGGPVRAIQRRWLEALRADDAPAVPVLRTVAHEFEAIGYRLPAADCHADAAMLAARAGLDPAPYLAEAIRLYAACGAVPLLGELPEARWIGAAETTARPA
jgi:class 3 adenylate cyclase/tetratricopeptide (TPR) repeat protein